MGGGEGGRGRGAPGTYSPSDTTAMNCPLGLCCAARDSGSAHAERERECITRAVSDPLMRTVGLGSLGCGGDLNP